MSGAMERVTVLDTPCVVTGIGGFISELKGIVRSVAGTKCVDFTNVHIVALRRVDPEFRALTDSMDYFVPDSQVLVCGVRLLGGAGSSRAYGPVFLPECIRATPAPFTHYFLGGSSECVEKLQAAIRALQPDVRILGARNGYFGPADEPAIIEEINRLGPDFIWVGLGTPKQQEWIHRNRNAIRRGILLAVGFAFDVNAGTKKDAPGWVGRVGLTWLYRLVREPRRLFWRYAKYNSIFVWYLFWQWIGRCFNQRGPATS